MWHSPTWPPGDTCLEQAVPRESAKRGPGPGAIRKVERTPLAKKWLQDKKVILHTDSAKSYKTRVPGVLHDKVVHGKKRVKVKGQWKWKAPTHVKLAKHKNPITKKMMTVKSGTQVVDRAWKFLKDRLTINQNAKVGSSCYEQSFVLHSISTGVGTRICGLGPWFKRSAFCMHACQNTGFGRGGGVDIYIYIYIFTYSYIYIHIC